jgi:hypothetical protein
VATERHQFSQINELFEITGLAQREVNGALSLQLVGAGGTARLLIGNDPTKLVPVLLRDVTSGADVASLTSDGQFAWADVPGASYLVIEALTYTAPFSVVWNYRDG